MTMHVHRLSGCSPQPLANYLKALGILRLVGEQADSGARGWWDGENFRFITTLDEESLLVFFLEDYSPTALLGPWGARSGFFEGKSETAARKALEEIELSTESRLSDFRAGITAVRELMGELGVTTKPTGDAKEDFIRRLKVGLRQKHRLWLDACVVLDEGGPAYPALLGTGGNEGSGSYASNFAQEIVAAIVGREYDDLLPHALFGWPTQIDTDAMAGQFLPIAVDPPNGGLGFWGGSAMNPWDFILCLEGACVFVPSVSRFADASGLPLGSAPFAVRSSAAGYGSAAENEDDRGEQWFPLWGNPATLREVRTAIAEGRSRLGSRTVSRSADFGRAVARLGTTRGITAFERYGYVQRNGRNVLAIPLGRWHVAPQPHINLLDQVAPWVDRLRRAGAADHTPASIGRAAQACEEGILAVCRNGSDPRRWQDLLVALGEAEFALPRSPKFAAERRLRPLPRLSPQWIRAADDGRVELRLALALAAQYGMDAKGNIDDARPVRRHFLPLDERNRYFAGSPDRLADPVELVCESQDLTTNAIALVRHRIEEAGRSGAPRLPIVPMPGAAAKLTDLAALLDGNVNEALVLALARPLMAVVWRSRIPALHGEPRSIPASVLGVYGLFRLAYHSSPISVTGQPEPVAIPMDPAPFAQLLAGDLARATDAAYRRLASAGLRPYLRHAVGSADLARRIAMTLAFSIDDQTAALLARRLTRPSPQDVVKATESSVPKHF